MRRRPATRRTLRGLALLGFTSVYREGFEVVLFLQALRLRYGSGVVLEGVALGLVFVAVDRVPDLRPAGEAARTDGCWWRPGVMLGVVLLVMVGESVQELQQAGWIGTTSLHVAIPGWMGLWFSIFPNVQTVVAQAAAAALVLGSYFLAEELKVRRPRRRGAQPAVRATAPPALRRSAFAVVPSLGGRLGWRARRAYGASAPRWCSPTVKTLSYAALFERAARVAGRVAGARRRGR